MTTNEPRENKRTIDEVNAPVRSTYPYLAGIVE